MECGSTPISYSTNSPFFSFYVQYRKLLRRDQKVKWRTNGARSNREGSLRAGWIEGGGYETNGRWTDGENGQLGADLLFFTLFFSGLFVIFFFLILAFGSVQSFFSFQSFHKLLLHVLRNFFSFPSLLFFSFLKSEHGKTECGECTKPDPHSPFVGSANAKSVSSGFSFSFLLI